MQRTWRYRLYPTRAQQRELDRQMAILRDVWNCALEQRVWAWREHGRSLSYRDQSRELTEARREHSWLASMNALAQHEALRRLDRAFEGLFRRLAAGKPPGFPRFKRRQDFIVFAQYGNGARVVSADGRNGRVALQGVGAVKFRAHRPLPSNAKLGQVRVSRSRSGRWWLSIAVALPDPVSGGSVGDQRAAGVTGIDLGVLNFAALSTGEKIDGPRPGRAIRQRLRRAQRAVTRRKHGSRSRRRAVRALARTHEKVAGMRRTHHHVVARKLVREHSVLAIEDLRIQNMTRSARGTVEHPGARVAQKAGLNRAILEQGWAEFAGILAAKAEEVGRPVVRVDARGSSQECPACGAPAPKTLGERVHRCTACGLVEDRDVAAAQVIAQRGRLRLNGSDGSRVEDASPDAPTKPNPGAETMNPRLLDSLGSAPEPSHEVEVEAAAAAGSDAERDP